MDFWVIAYILLFVVLGGYSVSTLYKRAQTIGAMVTLVLLLLIFTFYGLRWFQAGKLKGTTKGNVTWPPIVNMCPDFTVAWKNTDGRMYCYDAGNVYGLKTNTNSNLTSSLTINGISGQSAYKIKGNTKDETTLKSNFENIIRSEPGNGIRWEGVWDGQTANSKKIATPA